MEPPRHTALREDRARPFSAVYDYQPTADADPYPLCAQDVAPLSQLEATPQALNHPPAFPQDGLVAALKHKRIPTNYSSALVRQPARPEAHDAPIPEWTPAAVSAMLRSELVGVQSTGREKGLHKDVRLGVTLLRYGSRPAVSPCVLDGAGSEARLHTFVQPVVTPPRRAGARNLAYDLTPMKFRSETVSRAEKKWTVMRHHSNNPATARG